MDCTRLLSLAGTDGRAVRTAAGIGVMAAVIAAPGLALGQTQREVDRTRTQTRTVEVTYDDDYYYGDGARSDDQLGGLAVRQPTYNTWRDRELRRQHGQATSYGDVNYGEDPGYGEFSYYGDDGRYQRSGATWEPTVQPAASRQRAQQQRMQEDLSRGGDFYDDQGYVVRQQQSRTTTSRDQDLLYDDIRYGRQLDHGATVRGDVGGIDSWHQQDVGMRHRQELPRTRVYLHDASLTDRGMEPSQRYRNQPTRQEGYIHEDRMWQQEQQARLRHEGERWGRAGTDAVSYGDVNYEEDPGYGEFSYYGDDGRYQIQGASQRLPTSGRAGTTMVAPGQPVKYYTTDWNQEETSFDEILREGAEE